MDITCIIVCVRSQVGVAVAAPLYFHLPIHYTATKLAVMVMVIVILFPTHTHSINAHGTTEHQHTHTISFVRPIDRNRRKKLNQQNRN